jgi:Fe-S oxidoreductase
LDQAKTNLSAILNQLEPILADDTPIVVLEPSCLSVFRDEMPGLFPDDPRAAKLTASIETLSEFIHHQGLTLPALSLDVRIHGHCHQKACGGMDAEQELLKQLGGTGKVIPAGCCGVAGAYGYHSKSASVARTIGLQEFKPHLDTLPLGTQVVADGFSCRGQIITVSGHEPLHLAEFLAKVLR